MAEPVTPCTEAEALATLRAYAAIHGGIVVQLVPAKLSDRNGEIALGVMRPGDGWFEPTLFWQPDRGLYTDVQQDVIGPRYRWAPVRDILLKHNRRAP